MGEIQVYSLGGKMNFRKVDGLRVYSNPTKICLWTIHLPELGCSLGRPELAQKGLTGLSGK